LNNITKASFVLGAIGGFIIAPIYIPASLGWTFDDVPWFEVPFWQLLILAWILISIGFFGLWRKSGNVIPLVSAICMIVRTIITPLGYYLRTFTVFGWPQIEYLPAISWIIISVGWITAGIAAWVLREEFSQFSIVAALVFLAFGAVSYLLFSIAIGWWYLLWQATGIVTGIYFLDAART
jgi:hypothetical protein